MTELDVQAVLEAIERKDTAAWDMAVSVGMKMREDDDKTRWVTGDIAAALEKSYGENITGQFAKAIKRAAKTVYEYSSMARFYPMSARQKIFEDYETATYSIMRAAKRFGTLEQAIAFIEECADGEFTVERANLEANKRLGKPVPPPRLLDAEVGLRHVDLETGVVAFQVAPGADLTHLQQHINKALRVQIHALEPESENENG